MSECMQELRRVIYGYLEKLKLRLTLLIVFAILFAGAWDYGCLPAGSTNAQQPSTAISY
jgi:hypothetical protein